MLFQKSRNIIICVILIGSLLLISLLFNSCLTTSQCQYDIGESIKLEIEEQSSANIKAGSVILYPNKQKNFKYDDLAIWGFESIWRYYKSVFVYFNQYKSSGHIEYNYKSIKRAVTYDFYETESHRMKFDSADDYNRSKGEFNQFRIKKFSKNYLFDEIAPYGIVNVGSQINSKIVKPTDLPVYFTSFYIDEKKYSILLTKIKVDYPLITNMPKESFGSSVRKMIRLPEQEYLVIDSDNKLCASFSYRDYKIYENESFNSYDMIQAIGIYLGIFKLLNGH